MGKSVFGREDRKPLVKNIVVGIIGAALCVWGIVALFAVLNGDRLETAPGSSLASDTQASSAPATDPPPTTASTTASTTAATTGTAESADPPGRFRRRPATRISTMRSSSGIPGPRV